MTPEGSAPPQSAQREIPWAPLAWFLGLLVLSYFDVLRDMVIEWSTDDDMGHGFFVPAVAGWIVWQKRERLLTLPVERNWWGLALVVFGAVQLLAGTVGAELFVARTAFLVSLVGMVWFLVGTPILKEIAFPLFLLLFMIRIPAIIYKQVTFPLQLFASRVAEGVLTFLNIPVLREGNILELASQRLSVVEACSGIRSLLSLSFLALVYGYFFDEKGWMRWALLAAAAPITVAANAGRVTATGILSEINTEFAQGFFHSMEGLLVFLVSGIILFFVHQLINRVYGRFRAA